MNRHTRNNNRWFSGIINPIVRSNGVNISDLNRWGFFVSPGDGSCDRLNWPALKTIAGQSLGTYSANV
jgi:hypothetical protein